MREEERGRKRRLGGRGPGPCRVCPRSPRLVSVALTFWVYLRMPVNEHLPRRNSEHQRWYLGQLRRRRGQGREEVEDALGREAAWGDLFLTCGKKNNNKKKNIYISLNDADPSLCRNANCCKYVHR